ncbi:MAG TPA: diacylglycerol kinase family protein [Burkholderiaceae bacterium]|nr:diacylglycerol kinase family protein [Burkholderiaceae bacterium]
MIDLAHAGGSAARDGRVQALVIINPISGRRRRGREIDADAALAREVLGRHHIDADVRGTTQPGDAKRFAAEAVASGCGLVVAWGGDGTVNETAAALARTGVPLAIVPAGSGNGLATDLRIPFDVRAALELAATGRTLAIDAGQVDDCLFFNIGGVGVDAVIAARFADRAPSRRGFAGYLQLSTAELLRYQCQTYEITIDGRVSTHRALLVAFANGRQYGNRMLIAPGARLDDGLLEVVIVEELSLLNIAWRLPSLFRGTLKSGGGVTMSAAQTLRVSSSGPIPYHVDGEPRLGGRELRVHTHRGVLLVRAPG